MGKGVSPKIWGPLLWRILFDMAWEYDHSEEIQDIKMSQMKKWIEALGICLPCQFCRQSFAVYSKEGLTEALQNNRLLWWMHALKNKVNEKLRVEYVKDSKCPLGEKFLEIDRAFHDLPYKVLVQRVRTQQFATTREEDRWMVMLLFALNYDDQPLPPEPVSEKQSKKQMAYMTLFSRWGLSPIPEFYKGPAELLYKIYIYRPDSRKNVKERQFFALLDSLLEAQSGFLDATKIPDYHF